MEGTPHPEKPTYTRQAPQARIDEIRLTIIAVKGHSLPQSDDELDQAIAARPGASVEEIVEALVASS